MVTKILLTIMLILYVALLIMRYKKKDNPKIEGGVQVVQGILWSLVAVDSWGHIQNDDITGKDKSQLMKKSLDGTFHWNENYLHNHHSYVVYSRNKGAL